MSAKRPTSCYETPPFHNTNSTDDLLTPVCDVFSTQNISMDSIKLLQTLQFEYSKSPKAQFSSTDASPKFKSMAILSSSSNSFELLRRWSTKVFQKAPNSIHTSKSHNSEVESPVPKFVNPSTLSHSKDRRLHLLYTNPKFDQQLDPIPNSTPNSPSYSKVRNVIQGSAFNILHRNPSSKQHPTKLDDFPERDTSFEKSLGKDPNTLLRRFSFKRSTSNLVEPLSAINNTLNEYLPEQDKLTRRSSLKTTSSKLGESSVISLKPSSSKIGVPLKASKSIQINESNKMSSVEESKPPKVRHSEYRHTKHPKTSAPSLKSESFITKGHLLPTLRDVPKSSIPPVQPNPFKVENDFSIDSLVLTNPKAERLTASMHSIRKAKSNYKHLSTPTLQYDKTSIASSDRLPISTSNNILKLKIYVELLIKPPYTMASEQEVIALIVRKDKLKNLNELTNLIIFKLLSKKQDLNLNSVRLLIFFKNKSLNPIVLKQSVTQTSKHKSLYLNSEELLLDFVLAKRKLFIKAECQEF